MAILESPDGRKYETDSPVEITRLKSYGYSEAKADKPEPKSDPKK